ncbi:ACP phosphodiesterase [Rurimicrobium arvi]|uniref:ACP phosphodiesterase n=1 Tax=Rurimicrobium arvi TaxID=2049916 RepID=A0ABP8MR77_9BACT
MNYLGHAVLSFEDEQILVGNMMGDFVKGSVALMQYPDRVRAGLMLHRKIDSFTDQHWAIGEAKQIFRPNYGLYSGAVVDTLTDHFVANDAELFPTQGTLAEFAADVYQKLQRQRSYFPERFEPYFESMVQHNWLLGYRSDTGLRRSLNGLMRRAGKIVEVDTAYALFRQNFDTMHQLYKAFAGDIIRYVKVELSLDGTGT